MHFSFLCFFFCFCIKCAFRFSDLSVSCVICEWLRNHRHEQLFCLKRGFIYLSLAVYRFIYSLERKFFFFFWAQEYAHIHAHSIMKLKFFPLLFNSDEAFEKWLIRSWCYWVWELFCVLLLLFALSMRINKRNGNRPTRSARRLMEKVCKALSKTSRATQQCNRLEFSPFISRWLVVYAKDCFR